MEHDVCIFVPAWVLALSDEPLSCVTTINLGEALLGEQLAHYACAMGKIKDLGVPWETKKPISMFFTVFWRANNLGDVIWVDTLDSSLKLTVVIFRDLSFLLSIHWQRKLKCGSPDGGAVVLASWIAHNLLEAAHIWLRLLDKKGQFQGLSEPHALATSTNELFDHHSYYVFNFCLNALRIMRLFQIYQTAKIKQTALF